MKCKLVNVFHIKFQQNLWEGLTEYTANLICCTLHNGFHYGKSENYSSHFAISLPYQIVTECSNFDFWDKCQWPSVTYVKQASLWVIMAENHNCLITYIESYYYYLLFS
jgi:hypothetical protein